MKSAKIIKIGTIIITSLFILACLICAIGVFSEANGHGEMIAIGLCILIVGPCVALFYGAFMYGFANVVENTSKLADTFTGPQKPQTPQTTPDLIQAQLQFNSQYARQEAQYQQSAQYQNNTYQQPSQYQNNGYQQ